jgi:hypothetical protein
MEEARRGGGSRLLERLPIAHEPAPAGRLESTPLEARRPSVGGSDAVKARALAGDGSIPPRDTRGRRLSAAEILAPYIDAVPHETEAAAAGSGREEEPSVEFAPFQTGSARTEEQHGSGPDLQSLQRLPHDTSIRASALALAADLGGTSVTSSHHDTGFLTGSSMLQGFDRSSLHQNSGAIAATAARSSAKARIKPRQSESSGILAAAIVQSIRAPLSASANKAVRPLLIHGARKM